MAKANQGKEEESGIDEELLAGLKQARRKPRNFALIAKGSACVKLVVSKRPIRDGDVQHAKRESGGNKAYRGVCMGKGGVEMLFRLNDEDEDEPVRPAQFKAFIAKHAGLQLRPRFEANNEAKEVDDDED